MSISGLDSALSGLKIAQQQLSVISNNVANVSTPGYSRKILPQQTVAIEGQTVGVKANAVVRNVDMYLARDYWTQVSAVTFQDTTATYMNQIQQFHGAPDAETSISAKITALQDAFLSLANQPDSEVGMQAAVSAAQSTAQKFNDYSKLMTQMRNDTQRELSEAVSQVNTLLNQVASLNKEIKSNMAQGRTVAQQQDQRDAAIEELSGLIEISFFTRGDGVLVVQTNEGLQLADDTVNPMYFNPTQQTTQTYYPASAAGLYVGGNPDEVRVSFDITERDPGGKIGALLAMRDETLPAYQAQLDELAHKTALRLSEQGLNLFTDQFGNIPANTDPVPNPPGPLTPVPYVGFSAIMQVNPAILNDNSLIRSGTVVGSAVQEGSNEVLRRVAEFAFGNIAYQEAQGNVDIRVAGIPDTLQNIFGLNPQAQMRGDVNIHNLSLGVPLNAAPDHPFLPISGPPLLDDFTIRIDEGGANDTGDITIDLTAVDTAYPTPPSTSGAQALVDYLNNDVFPTLAPPLDTTVTASLNQFGQLMINAQHDIGIGVGNMGEDGLEYLGLKAGTTQAVDPYFTVQVGQDDPVRVSISPGDTETDLLTKLNNIPGVQASIDPATGFLSFRPGPGFGGDIRIVDGTILSAGGNTPSLELLGSASPVVSVAHAPFRETQLGAGLQVSSGLPGTLTLEEYSQRMISNQVAEVNATTAKQADEASLRDLLNTQLLNESGVNLDEELSHLIVVQSAFAASAKTITAIDEMFQQLLNAF
ncbi:flagellar hook-associated protein FlgK [Micavibrio aeruginosavorus]|uniref:Flagellar hook-associated protein 1 n=1 Tax=Micavibrio aeruginosavorus EPB TaxID=349215 RepID=M4VM05_9BACT|nr:flagellar hook-associated protein FlgK [Micavibrio aeruginosavorus]AGH99166.1 Flagellar hook-associated protein FlgK [Micavibrio aeruginosavorus EPB]